MQFNYYPDTDSLYINLSNRSSTTSQEASKNIVLDFDEDGNLVGIDIDQASQVVDLNRLTSSPVKRYTRYDGRFLSSHLGLPASQTLG